MSIEYSWNIVQLERQAKDGFVFMAHYNIDAKYESFYANRYGSIQFEKPESLIPYEKLTKEIVLDWIKESLGKEEIENIEISLLNQIEEQKNPKVLFGLPWE